MKKENRKTIIEGNNTARIVLEGNRLFFEFGYAYGIAYTKIDIGDMFTRFLPEIIKFAKSGGFDDYLLSVEKSDKKETK